MNISTLRKKVNTLRQRAWSREQRENVTGLKSQAARKSVLGTCGMRPETWTRAPKRYEATPYDGASYEGKVSEANRRTGLVLLSCGGRAYLLLCCISVLASFLRSFILSSGLTFSIDTFCGVICSPFGVACVFSVFSGGGCVEILLPGRLISREALFLHFQSASVSVVAVFRPLPSAH